MIKARVQHLLIAVKAQRDILDHFPGGGDLI